LLIEALSPVPNTTAFKCLFTHTSARAIANVTTSYLAMKSNLYIQTFTNMVICV